MLGKVHQDPLFYTDPGYDRQLITSINYPQGEYYVVGWTPIGGVKYPIGNMYNRDPKTTSWNQITWFKQPDLVGGWKTSQRNQTDDLLSLSNQTQPFVDPIEYQVNSSLQQYYVVGLMPVGMNVSVRALLGVRPYA
jgi:hypothetical protein